MEEFIERMKKEAILDLDELTLEQIEFLLTTLGCPLKESPRSSLVG